MRWFAVAAVVVAALAVSGTAWGKCGHGVSKKVNPAVREYVEIIPTACGPKARRVGGGTTSLPSSVEHQLSRLPSGVGGLLRKVGTSESRGAPLLKLGIRMHSDARGRGRLAAGRNPLAASVATVTGGSDGRLIGLLVVMALVVVVVAGMAAYRRRLSR